MLQNVDYAIPRHKIGHKKVRECEALIQKLWGSSRQKLAVSIHESAHKLEFDSLGVVTRYGGPAIYHSMEEDRFMVAFGQVGCLPQAYIAIPAEKLARVLVAGKVAEKVILGFAAFETSESDFEQFIYSGKAKPSELILMYKRAEEQFEKDLRSDLNWQREIVREGQRYEQEIFGIDRTIREASNTPTEIAAG